MIFDTDLDNEFFGYHTKSIGNKIELHQIKVLLHSKGNNQQYKKLTCGMGKYFQIIYLIRGSDQIISDQLLSRV